jgi:uncharacterized protein involved in exopolysaccharide biosynthesis
MEDTHFNLWKLLEVIARRIRFILAFVILATVISIVVSLLMPRWYEAAALLMPPREEGFKTGWSSGSGDLYSLTSGVRLPLMATPSDIYARILYSRQMAERVAGASQLENYYGAASLNETLEKLSDRSEFRVTPEGLLEIKCIDKDAAMSAQIANSFADELGRMTRELAVSRAGLAKKFIAGRLEEVKTELDSARAALENFQKEYKAIDLDKQTQLAIESAVSLKVELANTEIDLNVREKSLSATHPKVVSLARRASEIKKQIHALEFGGNDSSYLNLPISQVPALKIKYAEITSRLKISEALYKTLSEQYEQAKIQEKTITPSISILDRAVPPELAIKPQRRLIVMITFAFSLLTAIFLALFMNYIELLKTGSPED